MDYYKLRSRVFQEVKDHLNRREDLMSNNMKPPSFSAFQNRLIAEYGVTEKMVRQMVERLVPGGTIENEEIARKEE